MDIGSKVMVLVGDAAGQWCGGLFEQGALVLACSEIADIAGLDRIGITVVQSGELPETLLVELGDEAIAIESLAAILLPSVPDVSLENLSLYFGLSSDDHAACLHGVFQALVARVEALAIAQLQTISSLLPRGTAVQTFFEGFRYAREMSGPMGEDIGTLEGVIATETPPIVPDRLQDPEMWTPLDWHLAEDLLGAGGLFSQALPTYETREGQLAMARAVIEAFNGRKHFMCEAGTGTGKSLAYLIPAIYWALQNKTPVVLSTNTKNLQSQLFEKDIPLIQQITGLRFKAALIKGRGNYLCLRKFQQVLENADFALRMGQHDLASTIVTWLGETLTGDLSEVSGLESRDARSFMQDLTASADECGGRSCRYYKQCFVRRARAKSLAADVVVANHALVLSELSEGAQALPEHAHLVLDEAHNLEEAATRYFTVEISRGRTRYFLRRLGRLRMRGRGTGLLPLLSAQVGDCSHPVLQSMPADIQQKLLQWEQSLEPFFIAVGRVCSDTTVRRLRPAYCESPLWQAVCDAEKSLRAALGALVAGLSALIEILEDPEEQIAPGLRNLTIDFSAMRGGLQALQDDLAFVMALDTPDMVFWAERDMMAAGEGRLLSAPVSVGAQLMDQLYGTCESIIFTSATLTVRGQFDYLRGRLGLDLLEPERLVTLNVGTPFRYEEQSALLVPMFLPEPTANGDQGYAEALGALLAKLFRRTGGRGLTLFTSYQMLQQVTARVREGLYAEDVAVLAQGEAFSREYLTETFRNEIGSVLMGTHSFWEGVDVVGESLSCVVLARLPFGVHTDPVIEARCEALEAAGQSAFTGYSLPQAVIRFRQGFGRLIRHRQDRGVVIVTDRRILSKSYGHWFRGSVPVPAVPIHNEEQFLDAVEQFLAMA
ncbi:MAG: ATP-dependent DNA helicase [Kiritimatiellia bacterium]